MKRSEKILLASFAIVFLIVVGGGLATVGLKNYRQVKGETAQLQAKLKQMAGNIAQGTEWQTKADWVDSSIPKYGSHEEASSKLFAAVQKEAEAAGLTISAKEMVSAAVPKEGDPLGYFDKASIKISFADAKEQQLFAWMHSLQKPKSFIGITRLQLSPHSQGKSVVCEVDITQFFRQATATNLSKAN
ncbi:MAG: hypothetical protein JWO08_3953 [Verrucomicrobiaceae bacterium]|nr:hypothetical protein [Verrucomicrobiaceae bacterium]